ncbi:unnamed protein product [Mytilus coruscus]|uniref:DDE-1 domain-containing protein n=1 Tax=Mytilus coruscus TaxID=42192 RepID=A0A6J8AFF3_MYTCO|nr:unnamed protein product [Mytilus coruscus]
MMRKEDDDFLFLGVKKGLSSLMRMLIVLLQGIEDGPEPTSKSAHQLSTKETEDPTSSLKDLRDKDTVTSHNSFPSGFGMSSFSDHFKYKDFDIFDSSLGGLVPIFDKSLSSLLGTKPVDGLRLTQTDRANTENLLRSASQVLGTAEHFLAATGHLLYSEDSVVPAERSVNATSSSTSTFANGAPSSAKKRKNNYGKPQNKSHNSSKRSGGGDIEVLPRSPRGNPLLLGHLDNDVQQWILNVCKNGGVINSRIVMAAAEAVVTNSPDTSCKNWVSADIRRPLDNVATGLPTGTDDKRQITLLLATSMNGSLLPPQLIYQGKTDRSFPKGVDFPDNWDVTSTESHWSNEDTMIRFVDKVILPYVEGVIEDLPLSQKN